MRPVGWSPQWSGIQESNLPPRVSQTRMQPLHLFQLVILDLRQVIYDPPDSVLSNLYFDISWLELILDFIF